MCTTETNFCDHPLNLIRREVPPLMTLQLILLLSLWLLTSLHINNHVHMTLLCITRGSVHVCLAPPIFDVSGMKKLRSDLLVISPPSPPHTLIWYSSQILLIFHTSPFHNTAFIDTYWVPLKAQPPKRQEALGNSSAFCCFQGHRGCSEGLCSCHTVDHESSHQLDAPPETC